MGARDLSRVTLTRWRWRLRGAVMWPTFVVCLLADTVMLNRLPVSGASTSLADASVSAGFVNLAAVAVIGPLLSLALRRARPDLPRVVARDYGGTAALLALAAVVLAAGLANRPTVLAAEHALRAQAQALRRYVDANAPAERPDLVHSDAIALETNLYRSCVPTSDPGRALCVFINTSRSPPAVRPDPDTDPNSRWRPGDFAVP